MRNALLVGMTFVLCAGLLFLAPVAHCQDGATGKTVKLPEPRYDGSVSVEKALKERRSVRAYADTPISLADVSQILWAADGITEPGRGLRTAPSAKGAFYVNVYLLAGKVTGLPAGAYRYVPKGHLLERVGEGDKKAEVFKVAPQAQINAAPAVLLIAGQTDRAASNPPWMYLEAGHVSQNVYLECTALGFSTVTMAGFKEDEVAKVMGFKAEKPIYLMSIGKKKE